jgi:hypothetical protein
MRQTVEWKEPMRQTVEWKEPMRQTVEWKEPMRQTVHQFIRISVSLLVAFLSILLLLWLFSQQGPLYAQEPGHQVPSVRIAGPPSISFPLYRAVLCQTRYGRIGPACNDAQAMYEHLVAWGVDPAVELAFALKETECGHTGPGRPPQRNLHNIICNPLDGGTCTGPHHFRFQAYPSYLHATDAFARLVRLGRQYEPAGRTTVAQVLPIYAPPFENDTALYIAQVETWVRFWQEIDPSYRRGDPVPSPTPLPTVTPLPTLTPTLLPQLPLRGCRQAITTTDASLRIAPDGEILQIIPTGTTVTIACYGDATSTAVANGRIWVQVLDQSAVIFPWIELSHLEVVNE